MIRKDIESKKRREEKKREEKRREEKEEKRRKEKRKEEKRREDMVLLTSQDRMQWLASMFSFHIRPARPSNKWPLFELCSDLFPLLVNYSKI